VKVGIFSLTLNSNQKDWVTYNTDHISVAKKHINALKSRGADIIVAFTHLALSEDLALVEAVPGIDIVLGGHEHQNTHLYRGDDFTPVAKADANARTVFIHHFTFDLDTKKLDIRSHLRLVDDSIKDDPETQVEIDKWEKLAFDSFREQGIDPDKKVAVPDVPLDGLESSIRNRPTDLTRVLAEGMIAQSNATASVFNSGSIRIDDVIHAGQTMTEYDLLRTLPFGGTVALYDIRGDLLKQVLGDGMTSAGSGGYLQKGNIVLEGEDWKLGGETIEDNQFYKVAVSDYLAGGNESGMEYFSTADERMTLLSEAGELRAALEKGLIDRFGSIPED
jgi:5'-nucleotidase